MSSKMRAGLIAGGFFVGFAALGIGLLNVLPSLAIVFIAIVSLLDFFGVGIVSGILAANWLDLEDYGSQFAAGGFAGAIASLVVNAGNLGFTALLFLVHKPNPTDAYTQLGLSSSLSLTGQAVIIIVQVVVRVLLLLVYMIISLLISGVTTRIVASGKSIQALQAIIDAQEAQAKQGMEQAGAPTNESETIDPALLPYRSPEYSPFVDNQQHVVISPWQRRRLEREGKLPPEDSSSGGNRGPHAGEQGPVYRVYPPPRWRRPTQR
jgi:hypothetical protein